MKTHIIMTVVAFALVLGLSIQSHAELPEDSPEYDEYIKLINDGKSDEAIAELERIIIENPGTGLESSARLYKAMDSISEGNIDTIIQQLGDLIRDFPESQHAAYARQTLIDYEYREESDTMQWTEAMDELFIAFGLPTLTDLAAGVAVVGQKPDNLTPEEYLDVVGTLISSSSNRLAGEPRMNVTTFLLLNYPEELGGEAGARIISNEVWTLVAPDEFIIPKGGADSEPPVLGLESPSSSAGVSSPVTVKVRANDGPVGTSGMDLTTAEFTIDGSMHESIMGTSVIRDNHWEAILFVTAELTPGTHSGVFRLRDIAGNQSELPFSFTVTDNPPDPTSLTLPTTQDSTLRAKKPNRNEGANPRLFLSHRLEARGKSQNPIVGFELANEDLTGLTRATLVMNVQDCDLPRRWGNDGRYIIACPVNEPWVEGNGNKYRVNGGNGKTKGEGPGVTWFSPVDNKIQNNRPNGSLQWDGARSVTGQPTAPPVLLVNDQTGPVEFDVTDDVLAGYQDGWVLKKQDESKFGNIRFYSKEGGGADVAPKLILEFGDSVAKVNEAPADGVLAKLGFGRGKLESKPTGSELPSFRERLQESPVAAYAGETLVGAMAGPNPALKMASKVAYRAWLEQGLG